MPRARKKAAKRGILTLMRRVKARGMSAVDRRSAGYRAVKAWRAEMVEALGGEQQVSPQRLTLLELAARSRLFLDHIDSYLLELPTLIIRRRKSVIPIVEQRQRLADSLARQLQTLGLDRVAHDAGSIPESWITKVRPVEEPEAQQNATAAEPGIDRDAEKSGGQE